MRPLLSLRGVSYRYPGAPAPALRALDLEVQAGEFVVLAGGSGSGKSTLLRAACGLVPHAHGGEFAGRLLVGGLDTREHGPAELAAVAGFLAQDPETQVVMGTVGAELAFPLENRGLDGAAVARGVEEAALALGIGHLLERPTHALSGGELQRVALGAALAGRPRLVLLDEPTSQLDPVAGDELLGVLRRLNEEWGTAVLLAEHRLERCLGAADRVIALRDGAVACDAPPRAFLRWAAGEAPGLETPAARLLRLAGLEPPPASVKDARAVLRARGVGDDADAPHAPWRGANPSARGAPFAPRAHGAPRASAASPAPRANGAAPAPAAPLALRRGWRREAHRPAPALAFDRVWHELRDGPVALAGVSLALAPGERVALLGRNGAGKSTLLRLAAGLAEPTRGRVRRAGRVALLLQHPGDYLLRERVGAELGAEALARAGLAHLAQRHPRDLSGGERQRLALAIVLGEGETPAAVCLDEPTRGMDRDHKASLAATLRDLAAGGAAVLVATHDAEFAAAWAERAVLLGAGQAVADAPVAEVLSGGWYFATQTARVLGGAAGLLEPEAGARWLAARLAPSASSPPDLDAVASGATPA
jgi:energy-coupling factor transport system ATP-binding protein